MSGRRTGSAAPARKVGVRGALLRWIIPCLLVLPALAQAHTILILGDSISAAFGVPRERGWVALLQNKLPDSKVINASISGETTDGGLARLPALLQKQHPDIVVLELGGNDGLRGFPIATLRANLSQLVQLSQTAGAKVLLVGMRMPPNLGVRFTTEFFDSYTLTAKQFKVPLVPFLLDKLAGHEDLMQADAIHPRVEGQQQLLDNVWPYLKPLL